MRGDDRATSELIRKKEWEERTLRSALDRMPERDVPFTTISGKPIERLYTAEDLRGWDPERDLGLPGEFPYTRGIHPGMYRSKLWTMRLFSGFGTPEDTNARFKYLLAHGQTGLSVAFDLPTLMGTDSDNPLSEGEVGKCGVAIDTLADMEVLFDGIPLSQVTTSMTINAPAAVLLAMYAAVAEKQGADLNKISGTTQNDILKEYIAQKEWIYPPRPSMRLVVDSFKFCSDSLPRWNSISISGYHIREAGSTAVQELAFTLRDGVEYVQWAVEAGMDVDVFGPRLSFFFDSHSDFFEEIAKFRAARRLWARVMRERFQARNEQAWLCRFHTQTAGCALTAQQPYNNVVRIALQALAAVLGGTQSLHTTSLDEALSLPTEMGAQIALRTQQIIAHESGVTNTVDPLGGAYFVEKLTTEMEEGALDYFERIDAMGGMVAAIEKGFPQREIQEAAYQHQKALEARQKIIVGVNEFTVEKDTPIETQQIGKEVAQHQKERLARIRRERDNRRVSALLRDLQQTAQTDRNLLPVMVEAVKAYTTIGEICDALKDVFGVYQEPMF
ncbi:MAG: methylmalonyl-CoA mutase family protein [Acidobacteria bacterium]|nr:methylmalonyl-CoA mutase family protein [Acidobacteriota bacterium]